MPTLEFTYVDPTNILHDIAPVVEGSKVGIVLHSDYGFDADKPYETTFRITGSEISIAGAKLIFKVAGIYDSVKFLGEVVKGSKKGTSSDAISQLAKECGLIAKVAENTLDKMVWIPNRGIYHDFMRNIMRSWTRW